MRGDRGGGRGERRPRLAPAAPRALPPLQRLAFADLKNSSDYRQASPILAAAFLETFAGEGPWAHLDIAGTAYLERGRGDYYSRLGATGYGVRLLAELVGAELV